MPFTCITCRVAFNEPELQRAHYKTDWHRYNLKRKVAELPPIDTAEFQEKVINQRNKTLHSNEEQNYFCNVCNKKFNSGNAFKNHLQSKKHLHTVNIGNDVKTIQHKMNDVEIVDINDDEDWEDCDESLNIEECLICSKISIDMESNIRHMEKKHLFFIPDLKYLNDRKGLIEYLCAKIGEGHVCLWCNKSFRSVVAVQNHMVDRGHCMMLYEGGSVSEYEDFYDYTSSYPENIDENEEERKQRLINDLLDSPGYELKLPSGVIIGHRELIRYYKQNLISKACNKFYQATSKSIMAKHSLGLKLSNISRGLQISYNNATVKKKEKDISKYCRLRTKYNNKLSLKANKMQHHFRDQILGA